MRFSTRVLCVAFCAVVLSSCVRRVPSLHDDPRVDLQQWLSRDAGAAPVMFAWWKGGGSLLCCLPAWRVLVRADGSVEYEGLSGVRTLGQRSSTLRPEHLEALIRKMEGAWAEPVDEVTSRRHLMDASPSCFFAQVGARARSFCAASLGRAALADFVNYLRFKTNAVQWLGAPWEDCSCYLP